MKKEKLWTKDFIIISVVNFFIMLVMYLLIVTIAPFAVKQYDASTSVAGLVSGIFIIGTLVGRLGTGKLIGHMEGKKVLLVGLVFFTMTTALYFFANNVATLLIIRLIHGCGLGIASTATGTMVAQIIPATKRGEGIGYFSMSTVLATAIGPFAGILLSQLSSYDFIFMVCLLFSALSFICSFAVRRTPMSSPVQSEDTKKAVRSFDFADFIEYRAVPIAIVTAVVSLGYSGVLSFLSFYAEEIHVVHAASFFFLVYAVAVFLSRPFTGKLLDLKGASIVVYPALCLFALGLYLLSHTHYGTVLLIAGAIIGLGFGNFQSCAQALAIKGVEVHRLGLATSTFFIAMDFGLGIGPYILGFIIPYTGYRNLYFVLSALMVVAIILYFVLVGRRKGHTAQEDIVIHS